MFLQLCTLGVDVPSCPELCGSEEAMGRAQRGTAPPSAPGGLHSALTWRRDVFRVGGFLSAVARKDGYEEKKESKHNI